MWVTEELKKSRNIANVRFPNRLLCTHDDTEKCYFIFFHFWFWVFHLFFQAAEVTGGEREILLQKTKEYFRLSVLLDSKAYCRLQALWLSIQAAVACGHQVYYRSSPRSADLLKYLWTEAPFSRTSQQPSLAGLRAPSTSLNDFAYVHFNQGNVPRTLFHLYTT